MSSSKPPPGPNNATDKDVEALLVRLRCPTPLPDAVARVQAAPVQAAADGQEPLNVPLHVHIEVMLEQIAVISARLQQMERAEQSPEKRKELREIGKAVRALRFQFDPYNEGEVITMVRKISQYAKAMQPAKAQARS